MLKRSVIPDLPQYVTWLTVSGRKASTTKLHSRVLKGVLALGGSFVDHQSIRSIIEGLILAGYSTSVVNTAIDVCRVYARYLTEKGVKTDPDIFKIKHLKDRHRPKATMSDEEIEAFVTLPPPMVTQSKQVIANRLSHFAFANTCWP
jgi:site-specific recombinase XerD